MKTNILIYIFLVFCLISCNDHLNNTEDKVIPYGTDLFELSHKPGVYTSPFYLEITPKKAGSKVIYTTDGSTPSPSNGKLWRAPIKIAHSDSLKADISYIPTTIEKYKEYRSWTPPNVKPQQANIIRFILIENDSIISGPFTQTYWVGTDPTREKLAVISIAIDTTHLFNYEKGIFVPGIRLDSANNEWTGNYHMKGTSWEKPIYFEYFTPNQSREINQAMGLRIHGLRTPIAPQKSLRIYANETPIDNKFFKDRNYNSISRFILRTPFSSWGNSLIKDIVIAELIKDFNLESMHYQPCILYINGEYWGLYNIRERTDEHYLAALYNLNKDSIHIIDGRKKVKMGNLSEWEPLWEIIEGDTMISDQTYKKVEQLLDIDEYIDYYITEIFFSNYDWPGNNVVSWKPFNKGKWRFMCYDLDATFEHYHKDNMIHATLAGVNKFPYNDKASLFFRSLLRNKTFKEKFINRYKYLLEHDLNSENTIKVLNDLTAIYRPFIQDQSDRWHKPTSTEEWEKAIEEIKIFLEKRPQYCKEHVEKFFKEDIFEN